ncbi:MAG: hypothetical protein Q4B71_01735 [Cardiobacteriaceae bacterium]|nr:hypothetical protein [Cardiobacteriaceae bacterium]
MSRLSQIISALIALWLIACLWQLWTYAPATDAWGSRYVLRSLVFSFRQASYSTLLSLALAAPLLWGAWAGRFQLLRHLLPITTILPTLIMLLIALDLSRWLNVPLRGMGGIVTLHAWLNAPLLTLLLLPSLERIPHHYHQQRQLLRLSALSYTWHVVLTWLRPALAHATSLVFLLCFTSFTIPLIIGGDPRHATLEVAIYQAVKYEFNLSLAAQLALLQMIVLLPIFALMPQKPTPPAHSITTKRFYYPSATMCECFGIVLLLMPVIIMLYYSSQQFYTELNPSLLSAISDSVQLAIITMPCALALHIVLLYKPQLMQKRLMEALYLMPTLILCLGTYLLAKPYVSLFSYPQLANVTLLSVTVQPYLYQLALPTWQQHHERTERLSQQLNLNAWDKWFQVDLPLLAPLLAKVAGLVAIICVGDVAISRFYTNTQFQTLAAYLSEELGHYRQQRAWQTSLYLLLLSLSLYAFPQIIAKLYQTLRKP